jgi:hypothetical protein
VETGVQKIADMEHRCYTMVCHLAFLCVVSTAIRKALRPRWEGRGVVRLVSEGKYYSIDDYILPTRPQRADTILVLILFF